MKKILLSITFVIVSLVSFGQYLNYGLRLGAGMANFGGDAKAGVSLDGGFFVNVDLKDKFGVGVDLLYGVRTATVKVTDQATNYETKTSNVVTALNVPIYLYVPFSEHIILEAGFNLIASGNSKYKTSYTDPNFKDSKSLTGSYDPKSGFLFGIRLKPSAKVDLGLRYMTTGGDEPTDAEPTKLGKSSVVQFSFGYLINW